MEDIRLANGELLEVEVNFMTLKIMSRAETQFREYKMEKLKNSIKKCKDKDKCFEMECQLKEMEMEHTADMIYAILRSSGKKVDRDEAMCLIPGSAEEIQKLVKQFNAKFEEMKKKEGLKEKESL